MGADSYFAGEFQRAGHRLDEAPREDESEACAAFASCVCAEPIEWHEESGEEFGGDPGTAVGDMNCGGGFR